MKRTFSLMTAFILLAVSAVAYAGSLSPLLSPAATSYTLSDIYTRLMTNAAATEGSHVFAPSGSPASSFYTLKQIYDAIPAIDATKVKSATAYLGITGSLLPNGGTATTAAVFTGATANLTGDWTLDTGTLILACATSTFDATGNKVADAYDGTGNGTNRWCMTDSGDASAGDILSGKIAWVDGLAVTGSIQTRTLSASTGTVLAGYYAATTLPSVDTDLAAGNIKSGVTIFGVSGNSNVVDTTSGTAAAGDLLSGKKAWVAGAEVTGNVTAGSAVSGGNGLKVFTIPDGIYSGSLTATANDSNLIAANIMSGVTIFGVTGSVPTRTLSASTGTVLAGYYAATTLPSVDTDLAAGNIKSGINVFGINGSLAVYTYGDNSGSYVLGSATSPGTALKNLFAGTSGIYTGGSQANGGADDYNSGGSPAALRYTGVWTQCNGSAYNATTNPGGNWCNTGDSGSDAKDNSTGLVWSLPCNGSGCTVLADASPYAATYSWDSSYRNNNSRTASQLCSDHAGWFLPHQKQLMQAYIDGSYGNLETSGVGRYYWSATTHSTNTANAWYVYLSNGYTSLNGKTTAYSLRCVRPAP